MSYDLFFKPRKSDDSAQDFAKYFSARQHYEVTETQALYQNEDTGVYFVFDLQNEPDEDEEADGAEVETYPVALNLNYFRPTFFGLEAEPEVAAFVQAFEMTVSDPQDKMRNGKYDSKKFLAGWNHGNEFGYSAILRDPDSRSDIISCPGAKLLKAWEWNRNREQLQNEFGESLFVPMVMFILVDGNLMTVAVWPDGIPIATTPVDCFFVQRKELAPRRGRKRIEDQTLVAWKDALTILKRHQSRRSDGVLALGYDTPPADVQEFVESLPPDARKLERVAPDRVLNQELVEKYSP